MKIAVDQLIEEVPVAFIKDCPTSLKTWMRNQNVPYANLNVLKEMLIDCPQYYITKPQSRAFIKFLMATRMSEKVTELIYNKNNPRESFLALKYKLKEL